MKCSLGIFAYNEEKNIGKLLEAILNQKINQAEIDEIFIVASGCTDRTVFIAKEFAQRDPRIKVLVQEKREGKFSAINLFLKTAKNKILVMESGDTLPEKDAIENLLRPFSNPKVGMTGAKPVPVDNPKTFLGFTTHLLWNLHHQISLRNPKMGEMVAFKKVFEKIPPTAVDEAYIEGLLKNRGYKIIYVPEAIVYNKGAETISDFLKQRRRIFVGHLHLKEKMGYGVSTFSPISIPKLILNVIKSNRDIRKRLFYLPGAIFLEILGRFLGWWDYKVRKKSHIIWNTAQSTKSFKS